MNFEAITAMCATLTMIGLFGLFLVNSVIKSAFQILMKEIRQEFATKDQLDSLEARFNDSFRLHRGGRGD